MDDLDQLTHLATVADSGAAEIDAQAKGPELDASGQPVQIPVPPDYHREATAGVDLFAALLVGFAPKCEAIWTDAAKARMAAATAPVMEKYGFTFGDLPPEIGLLFVAGPLLWQSSRVVAQQMADDNAKKLQAQRAAAGPTANQGNTSQAAGPEVLRHAQVDLYKP